MDSQADPSLPLMMDTSNDLVAFTCRSSLTLREGFNPALLTERSGWTPSNPEIGNIFEQMFSASKLPSISQSVSSSLMGQGCADDGTQGHEDAQPHQTRTSAQMQVHKRMQNQSYGHSQGQYQAQSPIPGQVPAHMMPRRSLSELPMSSRLPSVIFMRETGVYLGEPWFNPDSELTKQRVPESLQSQHLQQRMLLPQPRHPEMQAVQQIHYGFPQQVDQKVGQQPQQLILPQLQNLHHIQFHPNHESAHSRHSQERQLQSTVPQKRAFQNGSVSENFAISQEMLSPLQLRRRPAGPETQRTIAGETGAKDTGYSSSLPFHHINWNPNRTKELDEASSASSSQEDTKSMVVSMTLDTALVLYDNLHTISKEVWHIRDFVLGILAQASPQVTIAESIKRLRDQYRAENGAVCDLDTCLKPLPLEEAQVVEFEASPRTTIFAREPVESQPADFGKQSSRMQQVMDARLYVVPRNGREIQEMTHEDMTKLLGVYRLPLLENMFLHDKKRMYLQFIGANIELMREILDV